MLQGIVGGVDQDGVAAEMPQQDATGHLFLIYYIPCKSGFTEVEYLSTNLFITPQIII